MLCFVGRCGGLLLTLLLPCLARAEQAPINIAIASVQPYVQVDQHGLPSGPVVKLIDQLFTDLQQPYNLRDLPPNRVGLRLIKGQAMLTIASGGNANLSRIARQGSVPLLSMTLNVYRKPAAPAISSIADLAGKQLIAITAYSYGQAEAQLAQNQPATRQIYANNHEAALQMLLHDRAEYLLDYAEPLANHLSALAPDTVQADYLGDIPMYWYLSHQYPDPALLDRLDQAVRRHNASGTLFILPTSAPN